MRLKKILSLRFSHIQRLNVYGVVFAIFFNEFLIYFFQRLRWEASICETDECTRILFVSDPQLLGEDLETEWFSGLARYDNDKHMERTFKQAVGHVKPNVVIFLGDLLDEGSISDDFKYQRYFLRFMETFPQPLNCEMIYLPGDNDIGGEGGDLLKPSKVKRFKNYFENKDQWKLKHRLNIYHINRIVHEMPILKESEMQEVDENSGFTRLFISHLSVILAPGAFSYKALERFKPHLIFSGHYHKSTQITSELNRLRYSTTLSLTHSMTYDLRTIEANQEVLEIQVPSCSYRMGEYQIGYGQAVIENGYLHYVPLFIPNRFQQFKLYLVFLAVLLAVNVIISRTLRNLLRRLRLLRQNYHPI